MKKFNLLAATTIIALQISILNAHALGGPPVSSLSHSAAFVPVPEANPFFPRRKWLVEPEKPQPVSAELFRVSGLSISPDRGVLCTINGRQLEPGKEATVPTTTGKL